ncbi:M48 family metallopeptidase [Neisseria lisongii]|uniref:M48 family metallopeptidase n=1 Tax=Neisseria lisongii TaxID=2912188 RepID=A0AAW5AKV2_9NEIS|nr:M48 family metallopeptidase [Neisseria lisongii]MCF7530141.1 M48 family metallopeptidase [Neisseria lisongii]
MKPTAPVRYYDGKTNTPHAAEICLNEAGCLCVKLNNGKEILYDLAQTEYIAAVGNIPPALELTDDGRIEFEQGQPPAWLPLKRRQMFARIQHLEKSWKWIGISIIAVICFSISLFVWGIPAAARYTAEHLPPEIMRHAGEQAEQALVELTQPSRLKTQRQEQIKALYYQTLKPDHPAKLIFRQGGDFFGANAAAIPNNTIIITDELISLTQHDHEILAVLAHEQGHLIHRHSLQQALQGVGISIFLSALTGDVSDLLTTLPTALVSAQYSQAFELEADHHAVTELKRLGIPPERLATFLNRLETEHRHNDDALSPLLSTHPITSERVKQIRQAK